jgi:hypothetical protein
MRKYIALALATLAATIVAAQCYGQVTAVKAEIPFAFQVGNKSLPAGEYSIQTIQGTNEDVRMIRRIDSSAVAMAPTSPVVAKNGKPGMELVFHKYGDRYFLSEIWTGGDLGRKLTKPALEKQLEREMSEREVAVSLHFGPERGL